MVGVLESVINSQMDSGDSCTTRLSSRRSGVVKIERRSKEMIVGRQAR